MRLAIADPPYPPLLGCEGNRNRKRRASRWYGSGAHGASDRPADNHPHADEWDDAERHRKLLLDLCDHYDGFAIATSSDGIAAYGDLPEGARVMVWVKPNAQPGSHRLRSMWEPVILFPPVGRRSNRNGAGMVPDVITAAAPRVGFIGAKPVEWVHWVLEAMSYDPDVDTVDDLFPGSGGVLDAVTSWQPKLGVADVV